MYSDPLGLQFGSAARSGSSAAFGAGAAGLGFNPNPTNITSLNPTNPFYSPVYDLEDEFPGIIFPPGLPGRLKPTGSHVQHCAAPSPGGAPDPDDCGEAASLFFHSCKAVGNGRLYCASLATVFLIVCQTNTGGM